MTKADPVRTIADAVLYEGYILWPYRRSATKNQRRWTFGGVYPRRHSEEHPDDRAEMQTQCLLEGDGAIIDVRVRFLHVVDRQVARRSGSGFEPVDELTVDGERHLSWDEAVERELGVAELGLAGLLEAPRRLALQIPGGREEEQLGDAGSIVRTWEPLEGSVDIGAERLAGGLARVTVKVANDTPWEGDDREQALRRTFCSTHTVLRVAGGEFVSLTDPPEQLREAAEGCENVGAWPVLVGEEGERHTLLCAPIILSDYPQIAPESPGDLFDATEIDQMLTLNILGMTDEEKAEMRASDPRAREILDRTASLSAEELMSLHGAVREFRLVRDA